ncbi:phage holin family protein [Cytophagaceae bacterium ABcell3]|nr:phage holin family protein [Cytophagaceae bacterium ABcell3]
MWNIIVVVLLNGLAVWLGAKYLKGISVKSYGHAIWTGILISVLNGTLGWVLNILALPLTWITFGLFSFVISGLIILLVDKLVLGFKVANFFWAFIFAIIMAVANGLVQTLIYGPF